MKKIPQKTMHENWLMLHRFEHEEEPKKWLIDDRSYFGDYHKDWLWIMPVLKKIGDVTEYELVIRYDNSYWNRLGENPLGEEEFGGYENILNVYKAIVEFLKWYNKNKETHS